jgi:UV DNA damage endonuclease
MRISMHPDQFIIINALKKEIIKNSIKEIDYHCKVLDAMKLDSTAKIQLHIGGVYGDKQKAINDFVANYKKLSKAVKKRLVIENDHNRFTLKDCMKVHRKTKIPVLFDTFHHECYNNGETIRKAMLMAKKTWKKKDGKLMIDYSNQKKGAVKGSHSEHIDIKQFKQFLKQTKGIDFDIMLEIKDKEKSALKAIKVIK